MKNGFKNPNGQSRFFSFLLPGKKMCFKFVVKGVWYQDKDLQRKVFNDVLHCLTGQICSPGKLSVVYAWIKLILYCYISFLPHCCNTNQSWTSTQKVSNYCSSTSCIYCSAKPIGLWWWLSNTNAGQEWKKKEWRALLRKLG